MTQIVKILPAMQESRVRPPGQEDPLEKGMATHSLQFSCLENPRQRSLGGYIQSMGSQLRDISSSSSSISKN